MTFLDLMALAVLLGAAWLHAWTLAPGGGGPTFPPSVFHRLRRLYLSCLTLLIVSSLSLLVIRGTEMSGVEFRAIVAVLPTVLLKTHFGSMWFLRLAGICAAWIVWTTGKSRTPSRLAGLGILAAAAIIAFSRSSSGHLSDFGDLSAALLGDWLHLLSVSCLVGSIIAIVALFPQSLVAEPKLQTNLIGAADLYYRFFGPLLAVAVLTGWHNGWLLVGSFQSMVSSPYGWILAFKLTLLTILVSRYISPPTHGRDNTHYVTRFLGRSRRELFLVIGIVGSVAILSHQIPSRHQAHLTAASAELGHKSRLYAPLEGSGPLVKIATKPSVPVAGVPIEISVSLKEKDGSPLRGLTIVHDRILHAVIIGEDLQIFAHIHPEDIRPITAEIIREADFQLHYTFPQPGRYLLGMDFATDEKAYSRTYVLNVAAPAFVKEPEMDFAVRKRYGDYQVSLDIPSGPPVAGTETELEYDISKNGAGVVDLAPYLGAAMHLAVVSTDLKTFIHAHGAIPGEGAHQQHLHLSAPAKFGPEINAELVFPAPGVYKIFGQFKHEGKVILTDFMVRVQ